MFLYRKLLTHAGVKVPTRAEFLLPAAFDNQRPTENRGGAAKLKAGTISDRKTLSFRFLNYSPVSIEARELQSISKVDLILFPKLLRPFDIPPLRCSLSPS